MDFTIENTDSDLIRVRLEGRLDSSGVDHVEQRFKQTIVEDEAGRNAVVQLTEVPFVASLGIRMLVVASKELAKAGRKLVLFKPHELVNNYLRSVNLYLLIPVAQSEEELLTILQEEE